MSAAPTIATWLSQRVRIANLNCGTFRYDPLPARWFRDAGAFASSISTVRACTRLVWQTSWRLLRWSSGRGDPRCWEVLQRQGRKQRPTI